MFNFWGQKEGQTFGVNIENKSALPSDLEKVKGTIQKTNKKYREEFTKYQEIAKFNKQLSSGYIKNLEVMVDVSKILNFYVDIFNVIKDEYNKNEELLGLSTIKSTDIAYLENLTRNKIDDLNKNFLTETDKLKKIYQQYGKTNELQRLEQAELNLKPTTDGAEIALSTVKTIEQQQLMNQQGFATPSQQGGKKRNNKTLKKKTIK